jgi:hypothetical protein
MTVAPANTSSIIVAVTGVLQDPSTYSVSGTTLTFSAAPPSGTSNISVRYLGIPASGVTTTAYRTVTDFTATAAQTSFSVPSYTVGYIDVYRNGVRLVSTDFTATTGTTVVLNNACTVGDAVVTESFLVSSVLNAIPNTNNAVTRANMPVGSVLQVVNATYSVSTSYSSSTYTDTGLTVNITPTSSTSKFLVKVTHAGCFKDGSANAGGIQLILMRNGSQIAFMEDIAAYNASNSATGVGSSSINYLDSPATSSAITYKTQVAARSNAASVYLQENNCTSTITVMEIAA